ncbi:MAG: calcium/sodium antiporter [Parcubacteria group bacterium]|nr:calcium/sodium antiporter [Parcubacteria group bacterium]
MLTNIFMVLAGFLLLIKGSDYFVTGSASLARRLGIPALVIGLTIISMGTSAPELFVNIIAAFKGAPDLSIGNVLGSNLADIFLGLGIAAIIVPLSLKSSTVWKEIPFALLAAVFIFVFGSDYLLDGILPNAVTRSDGIALLGMFIIFMVYTLGIKKSGEQPQEHIDVLPLSKTVWSIGGGVMGLALGGYITVEGAVGIANTMGLSQNLIGLTIVAAGTSLPEIMTAITAARKNHIDLVVGGIVGTIIFNALFVLGTTAVLHPLPFATDNIVDSLVVIAATILLFLTLFTGKGSQRTISRREGIFFVILYVAYLVFAVVRG